MLKNVLAILKFSINSFQFMCANNGMGFILIQWL
jgi:hypothetical protein